MLGHALVLLALEGQPHLRDTVLLEGSLGVGTPLGWAGAAVVVIPVQPLALHAGIGAGSHGTQIEAGARLRLALEPHAFFCVGASWSTGRFIVVPSTPPFPEMGQHNPLTYYWPRAHFANGEIGYEHTWAEGMIRPFLGVGYVVDGDDAVTVNLPCNGHQSSCSKPLARVVPYFGLAVAFGIL